MPLLTPTGVTRVAKHHSRPGFLFDFPTGEVMAEPLGWPLSPPAFFLFDFPIGEAMAEPLGWPPFHFDTSLAFPIGEAMAEPLG